MGTQIAAQVGGTLAYLVEAVERRIVPVLARTRHDGRFGGAFHCDRHPSESRVAVQRAESGALAKARFDRFFTNFRFGVKLGHAGQTSPRKPRNIELELISIPWNFSSRTRKKKLDSERQSEPKAGGFPAAAAAANCRPHDPGRGCRCAVAHGHLSGVGRAHPQVPTPTASGRVAR